MATVSEMGPMIAMGSTKAQGSKAKPIGRVRAPVWAYGEVRALAGSHPRMVTQAPLRS
jgi:hypothetical protein